MSSVFQALLGLTAAKDRAESSSEGRGRRGLVSGETINYTAAGLRATSQRALPYLPMECNSCSSLWTCVLFSQCVCKRGRGDGHGGPAGTPLKDPQLSTPHVLSQPGSKGSSTKRKRERQRARDSTEQHTPRREEREREEREREERAESKGSEAGSLGGGLRRWAKGEKEERRGRGTDKREGDQREMASEETAGGARKATKSKLFEFLVHGVVRTLSAHVCVCVCLSSATDTARALGW